jgi:hypothetical protein
MARGMVGDKARTEGGAAAGCCGWCCIGAALAATGGGAASRTVRCSYVAEAGTWLLGDTGLVAFMGDEPGKAAMRALSLEA